MSFVSVPQGVKIVHLGKVGTQDVVNTIGCINGSGTAIGDDMATLAKHHGDAWRARILPLLTSAYVHQATLAYSMSNQSLAPGVAALTGTAPGRASGQSGPLNACMVISFKTAKRGRTYAGRTFLSPLPYNIVSADGQTWGAEMLAAAAAAWAGYKADVDPLTNTNGALAVISHGSPAKGISPAATPVTSIICRPQIGTQRRRVS